MSTFASPWHQRFSLEALPREAWKNAGGWTRPIASRLEHGNLRWRVSVADVSKAGPFSQFEGVDRTAVMVQGDHLRLSCHTHEWIFDGPGSVAKFPGELAIDCDTPSSPARLWNVMVARKHARATVQVLKTDDVAVPKAPDVLVLVLRGSYEMEAEPHDAYPPLAAGDGLHLKNVEINILLRKLKKESLLLITQLW